MKKPPQDMLEAAQNVLQNAYAPYSNFQVAACMRTSDNQLFVGCNVENASFSICVCAEGGAISQMIANGHKKISEALVLVPGKKLCPPCGACRQRLIEFSPLETPIHLCTTEGEYAQYLLHELMPLAFGPDQLEKS